MLPPTGIRINCLLCAPAFIPAQSWTITDCKIISVLYHTVMVFYLPYKWVFNSKISRNGSTQKVLSLWHSLKNSCCAKHLNTKNLHELIQLSEIEDRAKAGILLWNKRVNWVEPDPLIWTELSTYSTALLIFPVWEPEAGVTEENPQNNR